jgi:predicted CDP-diglyceride synthetase/phosphatidate cytidylyltransferase
MDYSGLILLVFIGIFVALFFQRGRKKLNLPIKGKHWWAVVIIFAVVMLLIFGGSHTPHTPVK